MKTRHEMLTTILNPSMTSARSRAALTRVRDFEAIKRPSKSIMALIQGSPTLVSRMMAARGGDIVMSEMRLESGFSTFCNEL